MAIDPLAKKISIGFEGGSITATRGLLQELFGSALTNPATGTAQYVTRQKHPRIRVIGGGVTEVAASTSIRMKYPTGSTSAGSGGEPIRFIVGNKEWSARLSGSHSSFNTFLKTGDWTGGQTILWKSEKGKPYGPFTRTPPVTPNPN